MQTAALVTDADPTVERVFADFLSTLVAHSQSLASDVARARLECLAADAMHHMCVALPTLTRFVRATGVERVLAHEAYLSVLQILIAAASAGTRESTALQAAARTLLDALTPFVSRADTGLRAALLEGYTTSSQSSLRRRNGSVAGES